MRPPIALALGAAFTAGLVGCTFLISFDDPPAASALSGDDDDTGTSGKPKGTSSSTSGTDGTSSSSSSGGDGTSSSSSSSSSSSGAPAYPPPCDEALAATACTANTAACGSELATLPSGVKSSDLVECDAAGKACIRHCTMGCAAIAGLPSQCGHCPDTTDRWWCGKDIGFVDDSRDVAVHCVDGKLTNAGGSPAPCGPGRCHTMCTRTSPPPLPGSCCQSTVE